MADTLVIQVPRGSPVERQLGMDPPARLADGQVVVEAVAPDDDGNLDPPVDGEVVLSVPSPEALARPGTRPGTDVAERASVGRWRDRRRNQ